MLIIEGILELPVVNDGIGDLDGLINVLSLFIDRRPSRDSLLPLLEGEEPARVHVVRANDWKDERLRENFLDHRIYLFDCFNVVLCVKLARLGRNQVTCDNHNVDLTVLCNNLFFHLSEHGASPSQRQVAAS